jgi:outer membrane protein insertion porin family
MQFFRGHFSALLIAAALVLGAAGSVSPASAQVTPNNVIIEGSTHTDSATIRSYFTGVDQASVNRGVADLSATGMFSKVSARIVDGKVIVTLIESSQVINRVAFEGNNKLTSDQLAVEVQSKGHTAFDAAKVDADVGRIRDAYKKIGRGATTVTYRLVQLPNGRVDVVFKVNEGDKTGVREIKFVGNQAVSSYRLRSLMQTTQMNFLSWLKTSDVYDPDRLAQDQEAIRKYYMRYGYADFHITNTDVAFQSGDDPGYVITITIDEGVQYHVSGVSVTSRIPRVDGASLQPFVALHAGDVYNASAVEATTTAITRELARQGYAFSDVRPNGQRDEATHQIALSFIADDGPKVYIERIDIIGNTRTRDYVIRREFDIGEGDPYNHVMVEQGERRLNRLSFFKKVHISTRPGSTPDRVIVTIEVEDQPTGSVSLSGGYSTTAGALAEVAFTETNFLGRGQYVKISASDGQYSRGWGLSFTEPYFLGQRLAAGFDVYQKVQDPDTYATYFTSTAGASLRLGVPITDEFTIQPTYSIYETQIKIPNSSSQPYDDCPAGDPAGPTYWNPGAAPTAGGPNPAPDYATINCLTNGEASVAIKEAAAQGEVLTSLVGYSLLWNSIDDLKNPSSGIYASFHQDLAGLGGQSHFLRETVDGKYYYPLTDDLTGLMHLQGGQITQIGGGYLPLTDNFSLGPTLVRGFAPGGIGPRDISDSFDLAGNGLGGTTFVGASGEIQFPIFGLPKEIGLKGAVFADAGTLFGFSGQTNYSSLWGLPNTTPCWPTDKAPYYTQSNCLTVDDEHTIRSSVGASVIWASPLGPIRIDYAYAITKGKYDQLQAFNFTGGAQF